jgi:hypothetical protein
LLPYCQPHRSIVSLDETLAKYECAAFDVGSKNDAINYRGIIVLPVIRARPFNLKGGGGYVFFLKKNSDFGGGKKNI